MDITLGVPETGKWTPIGKTESPRWTLPLGYLKLLSLPVGLKRAVRDGHYPWGTWNSCLFSFFILFGPRWTLPLGYLKLIWCGCNEAAIMVRDGHYPWGTWNPSPPGYGRERSEMDITLGVPETVRLPSAQSKAVRDGHYPWGTWNNNYCFNGCFLPCPRWTLPLGYLKLSHIDKIKVALVRDGHYPWGTWNSLKHAEFRWC